MGCCAGSLKTRSSTSSDSQVGIKPKPIKIGGATTHIVCLVGAAGAGKGTQSDRIIEEYGLVHLSVAEIIKHNVKHGTDLGMKALPSMKINKLVPSELICSMVAERLAAPDVTANGCLLENFPNTEEQALELTRLVEIDLLLVLDIPDEVAVQRLCGRCLDPQTGAIYHTTFQPPPLHVQSRLEGACSDSEEAARARLRTWNRHIGKVSNVFSAVGKLHKIDGFKSPQEVTNSINKFLNQLKWNFSERPYFGNMAFDGRFSAQDAKRAGFYWPQDPPLPGDEVVSFRSKGALQKHGIVTEVEPETQSDGTKGLIKGEEGVMVTVAMDNGKSFKQWSVFLAPNNDLSYSSVCTTAEFQASHFCRSYSCSRIVDADFVSKVDARKSLEEWLQNLSDTDGEPVEFVGDIVEKLLAEFDELEEGSIFLYTTNEMLSKRLEADSGKDFSSYFRALNNTLNNESPDGLRQAMPLIQRMIFLLLYTQDGDRRLHKGSRVWKGDASHPVPLNLLKLKNAVKLGCVVRFRQFLSTTTNEQLASKYMRREDKRGFLWSIDIPPGFWGARDIADVSSIAVEAETLFPPYAAFHVKELGDGFCHLQAVDRSTEIECKAKRHGLNATHVELLDY